MNYDIIIVCAITAITFKLSCLSVIFYFYKLKEINVVLKYYGLKYQYITHKCTTEVLRSGDLCRGPRYEN